jgi:mono/diheme cytochrome c family protein
MIVLPQGHDMRDKAQARTKVLLGAKCFIWPALLLVTLWAESANAADRSAEGKAILYKHCARCHAIQAAGESPLKTAPPMRDIYGRYATRELREELLEGMVSKHKEMPQISFSAEDVAAILAYLYDLAGKR